MVCAALQVQAVDETLQSHYDGNIVEKELPVHSADQTQTLAQAHTTSQSVAEADVKIMSQSKADVAPREPTIKTQSRTEKSKDMLLNFEAKLRQVQLGTSSQPSQAQVNRDVT